MGGRSSRGVICGALSLVGRNNEGAELKRTREKRRALTISFHSLTTKFRERKRVRARERRTKKEMRVAKRLCTASNTSQARSAPLKHPIQVLQTRRKHNVLLEQPLGRDEVLLDSGEKDVLERVLNRRFLLLLLLVEGRGGWRWRRKIGLGCGGGGDGGGRGWRERRGARRRSRRGG